MTLYLKQAIFVNRAPFDHIELNFKKDGVNVLSAINGRGKTTILSHIVDAFFELAKPHYPNEFEDKPNKYYRVSSSSFNLDMTKASYVYLRFVYQGETNEENWDYLDIRNKCTEEEYNNHIRFDGRIPYNQFSRQLENDGNNKLWNRIVNTEKVHKIFNNNFLTYFPSYRYETPGYLNEPYAFKIKHKIDSGFSGYLPNPIEAYCLFKDIANWLLDVELDNVVQIFEINNLGQRLMPYIKENPMDIAHAVLTNPEVSQVVRRLQNNVQYLQSSIVANVNTVFSHALSSKYPEPLKLNIGSRALGGVRINVVKTNNEVIYPSIFNMSSGEKAVISIFVELLRQMDNLHIKIENITGIVLIDEVDKNLHIKMQHDVLPKLFKLFPNVQFIVSSHSPFLNMGLADEMETQAQIIDLDNNGLICLPRNNDMYREVYEMMLHEKADFAAQVDDLKKKLALATKTLIITEGKTDIMHINKAKEKLGIALDYDTISQDKQPSGNGDLVKHMEQLAITPHTNKIIGIFDCDDKTCKSINEPYTAYGNNVYAFKIKSPQYRVDKGQTDISIEYLYSDDEVKTMLPNGTRLFFGTEFSKRTGLHIENPGWILANQSDRGKDKIVENEGGQAVYDSAENNYLAKKSDFAQAIVDGTIEISESSWGNFRHIFDTIETIMRL